VHAIDSPDLRTGRLSVITPIRTGGQP